MLQFTILIGLLFCLPLAAQDRLWVVSITLYGGAQATDIASARGHLELNPLMRGPDGRFSTRRAVVLKGAITGATIAGQWLVLRKRPGARRMFTALNFGMAGALAGVAIRNTRN